MNTTNFCQIAGTKEPYFLQSEPQLMYFKQSRPNFELAYFRYQDQIKSLTIMLHLANNTSKKLALPQVVSGYTDSNLVRWPQTNFTEFSTVNRAAYGQ